MSQEHNDESNVDSKSEYADILGLQFEELIVGLNVDGVLNVASILDIRKTRYSDKNKFFIIREIRNYMIRQCTDDIDTGLLVMESIIERTKLLLASSEYCEFISRDRPGDLSSQNKAGLGADSSLSDEELGDKEKRMQVLQQQMKALEEEMATLTTKGEKLKAAEGTRSRLSIKPNKLYAESDFENFKASEETSRRLKQSSENVYIRDMPKTDFKFQGKRRVTLDSQKSMLAKSGSSSESSGEDTQTKRRHRYRRRANVGTFDDVSGEESRGEGTSRYRGRLRHRTERKNVLETKGHKSGYGTTSGEKYFEWADPSEKRRDEVEVCDRPKLRVDDLREAIRREFRIKGQIGRIGDKDNRLDFVSVKRQVEMAISKGYSEMDIVEAVINATTAGSDLRSLLQSMRSLSINRVLDILRSYYQEFDEGDLLQQLATAQQGNTEDPQAFVIRVLAIKNRILLQSEQDDTGLSEVTVCKIMCKSLESGIWNESIRGRMRHVLSSDRVSDIDILREIGLAVQSEKARKEKFNGKKQVRFNTIQESEKEKETIGNKTIETLTQVVSELTGQVNELKSHVSQQRIQYGCSNCKEAGVARNCSHCFRCGCEAHQIRDCPENKSLNEERPLASRDGR